MYELTDQDSTVDGITERSYDESYPSEERNHKNSLGKKKAAQQSQPYKKVAHDNEADKSTASN